MTAAMLARLVFAIVAALGGATWLYRALAFREGDAAATARGPIPPGEKRAAPHFDETGDKRSVFAAERLRIAVLIWCAVWSAIWLALALIRLRYPYELEWVGGAMRDHCEQLLAGKSLYPPPGPGWFPFEYPPLYFWASALLMRVLHDGSFVPMRLVSILSTLGCAAILFAWVRLCAPGSPRCAADVNAPGAPGRARGFIPPGTTWPRVRLYRARRIRSRHRLNCARIGWPHLGLHRGGHLPGYLSLHRRRVRRRAPEHAFSLPLPPRRLLADPRDAGRWPASGGLVGCKWVG